MCWISIRSLRSTKFAKDFPAISAGAPAIRKSSKQCSKWLVRAKRNESRSARLSTRHARNAAVGPGADGPRAGSLDTDRRRHRPDGAVRSRKIADTKFGKHLEPSRIVR